MIKFIAKRVGLAFIVLVIVSLGVSWLIDLIPGSPAALILGDTSAPGAMEAFNAKYGYDRPFFERYFTWIQNALQGDLGRSVHTDEPVTQILSSRIGVTLQVAVMSMALALLLSVPLAVYTAAQEGGRLDRAVTAIASALFSMPGFVTMVFASHLLAVQTGLLPLYGWVPPQENLGENLQYIAMPVLVLGLSVTPLFLRVLRADVIGVLREDFVLAARAKGLPTSYILFRHVLRPASMSLITIGALVFGFMVGGTIVTETFFALPGIGQAVAQAVTGKDLPIIQGVVIIVAVVYVFLNTLVDVLHTVIDPRVASAR